jgi:hypothetical protein
MGSRALRKNKDASNAQLFDRLCKIAAQVAGPIVRVALFREAEEDAKERAKAGADAWLSEAERVLQGLLAEPGELEGVDQEKLREELSAALQEDVLLPNKEEVNEHAQDLARMMMSAWLELLRDALSKSPSVPLTEDLLPPRETVRPEFWRAFADTIAPFAINEAEAAQIRIEIGKKLFGTYDTEASAKRGAAARLSEPEIALPFDLSLKRVGNLSLGDCLIAMRQADNYDSRRQAVDQSLQLLDAALAR